MNKMRIIGVCISIIIIVFGISGYFKRSHSINFFQNQKIGEALDEAWIKNATYDVDGQMIKLSDGKAEITKIATSTNEDSADVSYTEKLGALSLAQFAFGNISNSGKTEAVVVLKKEEDWKGGINTYLVVWEGDKYSLVPSYAPRIADGEKINQIKITDGKIIFSLSRYGLWDFYNNPTHDIEEEYLYRNGTLALLVSPFAITSTPALLETAIAPSNSRAYDELISPDGEWYFSGIKYFGKEPFSRSLNWSLEFISLKGRGSRYVYQDWSERPEDGHYTNSVETSLHPIGWSKEGDAVYMAFVNPLITDNPSLPEKLSRYWGKPLIVTRLNLLDPKYNNSNYNTVQPKINDIGKGFVLDLLPKENRALWFEPAVKNNTKDEFSRTAPARLIYFSPSDNDNAHIIAQLDKDDSRTVTSASLDRDPKAERVAYILHQAGKNDEAFVYVSTSSTTSTAPIDLKPYRDTLLKNGIQEPYQLIVEKTAMVLPGGLFLVVIGANNQIIYIRFDESEKGWENIGMSKNTYL